MTSRDEMSDADVQKMCAGLFHALTQGDSYIVNMMLEHMNPMTMPSIMIVGLIRYSFSFRDLLPAWTPFLKRAHEALTTRKEKVDELLRGLLQYID